MSSRLESSPRMSLPRAGSPPVAGRARRGERAWRRIAAARSRRQTRGLWPHRAPDELRRQRGCSARRTARLTRGAGRRQADERLVRCLAGGVDPGSEGGAHGGGGQAQRAGCWPSPRPEGVASRSRARSSRRRRRGPASHACEQRARRGGVERERSLPSLAERTRTGARAARSSRARAPSSSGPGRPGGVTRISSASASCWLAMRA